MALVDWRVLSSSEFVGRIAEDASPKEQARALLQICEIVRSEGLHGIILDMDHSVSEMPGEAAEFAADLLADELVDSGLTRFALVHRGIESAWWARVVDRLKTTGVASRGCRTIDDARTWFNQSSDGGAA